MKAARVSWLGPLFSYRKRYTIHFVIVTSLPADQPLDQFCCPTMTHYHVGQTVGYGEFQRQRIAAHDDAEQQPIMFMLGAK